MAGFAFRFSKAKPGDNVLDIGTGTGVIPILMAAKTKAGHFTGLEIQHESADMGDAKHSDIIIWKSDLYCRRQISRRPGHCLLRLLFM